jgi:NADH:ubiquinone oxidoreductase subunit 5 (subunit L)/multisubunit Na+/H+ antiporter MnhA subunit
VNSVAPSLLAIALILPLAGAAGGLTLWSLRLHGPALARTAANFGILCGFLAMLGLAVMMQLEELPITAISLGIPGRWGGHWNWIAHVHEVHWLAAAAGIAWLTVSFELRADDTRTATAFCTATAAIVSAAFGIALASSLIQLLFCWTVLSLATLAMLVCSSPPDDATDSSNDASHSSSPWIDSITRAIRAGLVGDILLLWAVVALVRANGSTALAEAMSPQGIARLQQGNPAFASLISCLIVLAAIGRCGLFPVFGWHHESRRWNPRGWIIAYAVGYVPAAVILVAKCLPLILISETARTLMAGLGTLGAVLGAFVACGQSSPRSRLGYVMSAQVGILLAGLASGQRDALMSGLWFLASLSAVTCVLMMGLSLDGSHSRLTRGVVGIALLSLAGLIPAGGWAQWEQSERLAHPVATRLIDTTAASTDDNAAADSQTSRHEFAREQVPPRWDWIYALWGAQGLCALAAAGLVPAKQMSISDRSPAADPDPSLLVAPLLGLLAGLIAVAGAARWGSLFWQHRIDTDQATRLAIAQVIAAVGLIAGRLLARRRTSTENPDRGGLQPLVRLSRERLYVDAVTRVAITPLIQLARLVAQWASPKRIELGLGKLVVSSAAWLGMSVESQQVGRDDFYLATILLGTVTLILTVILVS